MKQSTLIRLSGDLLRKHIEGVYDKIIDEYPNLSIQETLQISRIISHFESSIIKEIEDDIKISEYMENDIIK